MVDFSDRLPGETPRAWGAFKDYLALGQRRSLKLLHESYCKLHAEGRSHLCLTLSYSSLGTWSQRFRWQRRAEDWDARQQEAIAQLEFELLQEQHKQKIDFFRGQHQQLGGNLVLIAERLIDSISFWLDKSEADILEMKPEQAASLLRAIAVAATLGSDMWGASLGVEKLMGQVREVSNDVEQ